MWRGWGRKPRLPGKFPSGPGAVTHGAAAGGGGRTHGGALGGVGLSARRSASSRKVDCFVYLKIDSVSARFDSFFRRRRFGLNETLFTAEVFLFQRFMCAFGVPPVTFRNVLFLCFIIPVVVLNVDFSRVPPHRFSSEKSTLAALRPSAGESPRNCAARHAPRRARRVPCHASRDESPPQSV